MSVADVDALIARLIRQRCTMEPRPPRGARGYLAEWAAWFSHCSRLEREPR